RGCILLRMPPDLLVATNLTLGYAGGASFASGAGIVAGGKGEFAFSEGGRACMLRGAKTLTAARHSRRPIKSSLPRKVHLMRYVRIALGAVVWVAASWLLWKGAIEPRTIAGGGKH